MPGRECRGRRVKAPNAGITTRWPSLTKQRRRTLVPPRAMRARGANARLPEASRPPPSGSWRNKTPPTYSVLAITRRRALRSPDRDFRNPGPGTALAGREARRDRRPRYRRRRGLEGSCHLRRRHGGARSAQSLARGVRVFTCVIGREKKRAPTGKVRSLLKMQVGHSSISAPASRRHRSCLRPRRPGRCAGIVRHVLTSCALAATVPIPLSPAPCSGA